MPSPNVNSLRKDLQKFTTSSLLGKNANIQKKIIEIRNTYTTPEKIVDDFKKSIEKFAKSIRLNDDIFLDEKMFSQNEIEEMLNQTQNINPNNIDEVQDLLTKRTIKILLQNKVIGIFIEKQTDNQHKPSYKMLFSVDTKNLDASNIKQITKLLSTIVDKINDKTSEIASEKIQKHDNQNHNNIRKNSKLLNVVEVETIKMMQKLVNSKEFEKANRNKKETKKDKNINQNKYASQTKIKSQQNLSVNNIAKQSILSRIFNKFLPNKSMSISDDIVKIAKQANLYKHTEQQANEKRAEKKDNLHKNNRDERLSLKLNLTHKDNFAETNHVVEKNGVISFGVEISNGSSKHNKNNQIESKFEFQQDKTQNNIQSDKKHEIISKLKYEVDKEQNEVQQNKQSQMHEKNQEVKSKIKQDLDEKMENGGFDPEDGLDTTTPQSLSGGFSR